MKYFILFKKASGFLLSLILFLSFSECLFAQSTNTPKPDFVPKSPEAAAFLKYGEYPVDLSTGVPGISIPLYTIDTKDFKLPISLDYHASGIKVNQEATWVGLGWNLNAGAQVILSPRDEIDENNLYVDEIPDADGLINYFKLHPYKHEAIASISPELDKSRVKDIYVFSSPTVNGSFYIKNFSSNEVVTIPPNAFKVDLIGNDRANLKFKITDSQGNIYTLNTTESSVRSMTHSDRYISAWYVDEIKTPSNNKITFVYQNDGVLTDKSFSQRVEITKKTTYGSTCTSPVTTNTVGAVIDENSNTETTLKKIKEIYFNDGKSRILFTKNIGRQDLFNGATNGYLSKIEIQQIAFDGFESIKGYTFEYSYFNTGSTYNDKRLRLDRLTNLFGENEEEFIYSTISLPNKTSKGQDYFGYNNGMTNNIDLIPKHYLSAPYPTEVGKADRSVSTSVIQAGILKEIHYRTKGWTRFNYENNQFYGVDIFNKYVPVIVNSNLIQGTGGTVPVKEGPGPDDGNICLNTNPEDCVNYVSIPYVANNATGTLTFKLNKPVGDNPTLLKYHYAKVRIFSGSSMVYNSGSLVGQEYNVSISLPQSGTIEVEVYGKYYSVQNLQLKYVNNDATLKNVLGAGLRIKNIENYDDNNSLLLKKEYDYSDINDASRTSGKLINEMTTTFSTKTFTNYNYYTCDVEGAICMPGLNSQGTYSISSNSRFGIEGNSVVYKYVKEKQVDIKNQTNNGFTQYEFTTGGDEIPLGSPAVQISTTWKRGKALSKKIYKTIGANNYIVEEEKNTYFEDNSNTSFYVGFKMFRNSTTNIRENSSDPFTPTCPYFLDGGIEVLQSIEPVSFRVPLLWYYQKTTQKSSYFYNSSNSLIGTVVTTTNFNYNPSHLQLSSQTTTNSKGEVLESKYFYAGDPEMTSKPFINELKNAYMIGIPLNTQTFKGGNKVSEQLTNYDKSVSTNNLLLPKAVYANKGAAGIDISTDKKITYDLYDDKGNILQYTPESGIPVSIVWGYNKTQPIAKIDNVAYSSISPEIITNLQTLSNSDNDNCISGNCSEQLLRNALNSFRDSLPSAFVSTYTYNPLVGVTSVTDPKGLSSYYEYDKDGRLRFVKDKDLNILQKYCYNYKGQTIDCGDNSSGSVVIYKSAAQNGSFTKNNCSSGGTGSSVIYNQAEGVAISTISQADANTLGLAKFNTDGQAYANSNGYCTYYSTAQSGSFIKNNCSAGGTGSSVSYSQAAGILTSTISQADADALGVAKFNADGQAYANANGYCNFYSSPQSGTFNKNDCALGGAGSSVFYSQAAGVVTSTSSQAEADALGLAKFNTDGQVYANANGYCTFYSAVQNGSFTKNNCSAGGVGSSVAYSQSAGALTSTTSQADADALGYSKFITDGQNYANANGYCTYYSAAQSGSFTKNNCASGGIGSSVSYSQSAGVVTSTSSQAEADALGYSKFISDGQIYANANGYCTYYSIARSNFFVKNNCPPGGYGAMVTYNQAAGAVTSTISQADADALGLAKFNTDGQFNANVNGYCTFYSAAQSGSFTKNNCSPGSTGSSVVYTQDSGVLSSNISQADADGIGLAKFYADGQAYANANGYCTYYSAAMSGQFTKNNCAAGGYGSTVTYSQPAGFMTSTSSQADADALGLYFFNANGQSYANANGYCTFYSSPQYGSFTKNNCPSGSAGSTVAYGQNWGVLSSTISQADADALGYSKFITDGQAYANANGYCTYYSAAQSGSFTKNNCASGGTGSTVVYTQGAGVSTSTISQADADALGYSKFLNEGQAYANANGNCTFYNAAISKTFFRNNCPANTDPGTYTYNIGYGQYTSTISQSRADQLAEDAMETYGQRWANEEATCTFFSAAKSGTFTRNNCGANYTGGAVTYSLPYGARLSTISQEDADNKAQADVNNNGQVYANTNGTCTAIPQPVTFTYEYLFSSTAKLLYLDVYASTANHSGATLYFNITYVRLVGTQQSTQSSTVVVNPQMADQSFAISVNAKSIVSVELVNIVRN
ncbi:DUF5977 domain-containing protein [Flavobacterium sp. S87F.05.LMB.W.Kidney.N]|uniref:DUF5977 domain-containing protein n=1 Tax=Flavobacterium sp. S87F.05.LMB.W.Kidney.N TaxID=1278758 RepID=UPI0010663DB1|nr:DUF5977 domain-containing protein [Flavobacterium sp. S87F.05.LMB.W.Kidney.N]TDX08378.1 hypothetical protein EDB96_4311 [Flavobacterium sp. S87F.05.LMB.W.Kidney.N]